MLQAFDGFPDGVTQQEIAARIIFRLLADEAGIDLADILLPAIPSPGAPLLVRWHMRWSLEGYRTLLPATGGPRVRPA